MESDLASCLSSTFFAVLNYDKTQDLTLNVTGNAHCLVGKDFLNLHDVARGCATEEEIEPGGALEDFLVRGWERRFLRRDPRDHLSMIATWLHSDISDNDRYDGDVTRALVAITARTLVMPASSDL